MKVYYINLLSNHATNTNIGPFITKYFFGAQFWLTYFHIILDTSQNDWHQITNPNSDTNHFFPANEGSMLIQTNQFDGHNCGTLQSECILK